MTADHILTKLSTYELIQKHQILEAYASYWADNVPVKPQFKFSEISSILEDAAEIVSRVRGFVDTLFKDRLVTLRVKDGVAQDFIFHTELAPENRDEFLRGLVFATLSVENNVLETGVSEEIINSFIQNYLEYKKQLPENTKFETYSIDNLSMLLSEIQNISQQIFEQKPDHHPDQREDSAFLKSIIKSLESIYLELHRYSNSSKFVHVTDASDSSDLSDMDDFVVVDNTNDDDKLDISIDGDKNKNIQPMEEEKAEKKVEEESKETENQTMDVEEAEGKEEATESSENIINASSDKIISESSENITNESSENTINESSDNVNSNNNNEVKINSNPSLSNTSNSDPKIDLRSSGIIKIAKVESGMENTVREINQLKNTVNSLEIDYKEPKASMKKVEALFRKCLYWGETLMKDLLILDEISTDKYPSNSDIRSLRKQKVLQIQSLMDEIEVIKAPLTKYQSELSKLIDQLEKQKEIEEAEKQKAEEEAKQKSPQVSEEKSLVAQEEEKGEEEEVEEEKDEEEELYEALVQQWKLLKIEPEFESERQRGRYIITASIPGMKEDDFKLQINEREGTLTISGCRLPSRKEVDALKKNLLRRYKFPNEKELAKQLFRYGINRFGSFSTPFSLPNNIIASKIEAKYEGGILYVILPVKVHHQVPQYGNPRRGFNDYFGAPRYSPNYYY